MRGIPNKQEIKGKSNKLKGAIKQKIGKVMGSRRLKIKGIRDKAKGNMQEGTGKIRRSVGNALKNLGHDTRK